MKIGIDYSFYHVELKDWIKLENNILSFYGTGGYGTPVQADTYNSSMHIRSADSDLDICIKPHLINLKYIDDETVDIANTFTSKVSEVNKKHLVRIRLLSEEKVKVDAIKLFAFKDNIKNPITDVNIKVFFYKDKQWRTLPKNGLKRKVKSDFNYIHEFYCGFSISPKNNEKKDIKFNIGTIFEVEGT